MLLPPLVPGRLIQRYKRFLADVALDSGETITAHCANPGSMLGLIAPGNRVYLRRSEAPGRKLPFGWTLAEIDFGWRGLQFVGIDTSAPNRLAEEAIRAGAVAEIAGYETLRREVKYGANSRVDFLLQTPGRPDCYVEVKNVHLMRRPGLAEFPDSVTARGAKHLAELAAMVRLGNRSVMLFVIQMDADAFALADDIDPVYAAAFDAATSAGVEAIAYVCRVTISEIAIVRRVPIQRESGLTRRAVSATSGR